MSGTKKSVASVTFRVTKNGLIKIQSRMKKGLWNLSVKLLLLDSEKGVHITYSGYPSLTPVCYIV